MVLFIGGCADGRHFEIEKVGGRYPTVRYLARLQSSAEFETLHINDTMAWKSPEDVYYLHDRILDGVHEQFYVFDRTVHYKP